MRWLALRRAIVTGDKRAVPPGIAEQEVLCRLLVDCVSEQDYSFLQPTLRSLGMQTFRDFEVVIVDPVRKKREYWPAPVTIGVQGIPSSNIVVPRPSPWRDEPWPDGYDAPPAHWSVKWPCVAADRNTAIVHARGERLIFLDDCMLVAPEYLEVMAEHLALGQLPTSYNACIAWPDHGIGQRAGGREDWQPWVEMPPMVAGCPDEMYPPHVGTPWRLADLLAVNGYDETFDPVVSLEDADLQARLGRLGVPAVRDQRLMLWELGHYHFHWLRYAARHNGLLAEMIDKRWPIRTRANDDRPDAEFWAEYRQTIKEPKWNCGIVPRFDLTAPTFDLAVERFATGNWVP